MRKFLVMDVFAGDPSCDVAELLSVYMDEFVRFDENELEEIAITMIDYSLGLCDKIFSLSPGKSYNYINNIIKATKRLNNILDPCDSIMKIQLKKDEDGDALYYEILKYWSMPKDGYLENNEKIIYLISKINAILIKKYKDVDSELLGLGLAIERIQEEEYGSAFYDLFIFNLRQLLQVLISSLEVEANRIGHCADASDEIGAPRDMVTGNFLLTIFNIYKKKSGHDSVDEGYYRLIHILRGYVDKKICETYGNHKKIVSRIVDNNSIRMSLSRYRKLINE